MKKSLSILFALTLAAPIVAFAQGTAKFGTVDMQRAFKDYTKTKDAEVKINDAKNAAKKEYDERAEAYKKALDDINNLNMQLESPALSADKKTGMAKERDDKIANIKNMEREISDFRQTWERQLQEQLMRMREGIVKEITERAVAEFRKKYRGERPPALSELQLKRLVENKKPTPFEKDVLEYFRVIGRLPE